MKIGLKNKNFSTNAILPITSLRMWTYLSDQCMGVVSKSKGTKCFLLQSGVLLEMCGVFPLPKNLIFHKYIYSCVDESGAVVLLCGLCVFLRENPKWCGSICLYALKVTIDPMHDREKKSHGAVAVCSFSIVHVALWSLQSGSLFYLCRLFLL